MLAPDYAPEASVVNATMPDPHKAKLKYALAGAGVPLVVVVDSRLADKILQREKKA